MASGSPSVRMSVSSWNVHGLPPEKHNKLEKWLLDAPRDQMATKGVPNVPLDIYVIGLQEVIPLDLLTLASNLGPENERLNNQWAMKLGQTLQKAGDFVLYSREFMWGIHVFVFLHRVLAASPFVADLSSSHIGTGFADSFGNKGAVGTRFRCFGRSLCFVCCHLEAGTGVEYCKARNDDYTKITEHLNFEQGGSIADHDIAFYFGDLNYRLIGAEDGKWTKKQLAKNGYQCLLDKDELLNKECTIDAFGGFDEMPLTFDPTYKYKPNTTKLDCTDKLGWTDRIIWKVQDPKKKPGSLDPAPFQKISPIHYGRAELRTSDHRPVFAVFDLIGEAAPLPDDVTPPTLVQDTLDKIPPTPEPAALPAYSPPEPGLVKIQSLPDPRPAPTYTLPDPRPIPTSAYILDDKQPMTLNGNYGSNVSTVPISAYPPRDVTLWPQSQLRDLQMSNAAIGQQTRPTTYPTSGVTTIGNGSSGIQPRAAAQPAGLTAGPYDNQHVTKVHVVNRGLY